MAVSTGSIDHIGGRLKEVEPERLGSFDQIVDIGVDLDRLGRFVCRKVDGELVDAGEVANAGCAWYGRHVDRGSGTCTTARDSESNRSAFNDRRRISRTRGQCVAEGGRHRHSIRHGYHALDG